MPNVGRPSKGCKNCRDKKLKVGFSQPCLDVANHCMQCDLKRPSCSQCIRSGKRCHGYRDPMSMMFKNESLVVAKKAEKRYEQLAKQKSGPSSQERGQSSPRSKTFESVGARNKTSTDISRRDSLYARSSQSPTVKGMVKEIVPPIEDQAIGFFISNHVSQPTIVPRGQFEWITEMLSEPGTEQVLENSVKAVSLAGLAVSMKSRTLMMKACATYGAALKMVNDALQVRDVAIKDSTLVSVIMLGMYEVFVFDKRSIEAWAKHVEGACALIKLRGKDQFKSSIARRVFHQFFGVVLLVSIETRRAVPDGILEFYDHLAPSADYKLQGRQWTTRLVHFMVQAINLSGDKTSDPLAMVTKALKLDDVLDSIKALIPNIWRYKIIHLDEPVEHVHGAFYHVYIDSWIAQMWNNLRSSRIRLYNIVRDQLFKGYTQYSPPLFSREEFLKQTRAAEQILLTTAAATCASAPQIAGMIAFPPSCTVDLMTQPNDKFKLHPRGTFLNSTRPTGLHHLIWPLFSAGSTELVSNELRQWTIDTLYFIALKIGTRQAIVLANELKEIQTVPRVSD
jgi:hypothetical protein